MQKSVGLVLFSTLLAVFCACHQKSDPYYYGPGFLYATGHADVKGDQPQSIAEARSSALVDARAKLEKKVLAFQMDQKRTVRTIIKENPDMAPKLEKMIRKS
ncbi:MAG TPA: hypothetical protein PKH07_12930, partial [bacterium]|nr:hypothetical protein [bacterium]